MPIYINKSLPSLHLNAGTIANNENKMRILVGTGAVINAGNKVYHQ